ncbi:MAG: hypothetical protein RR273_05145, partial [Oscillospiraceae bacterium]
MISGLIAIAVTLAISFLLTPYIVENLGDEAYGYIGLSGNFIVIASVFTTALNSMANRFILIAYEKQDEDKVNEYFSSLFVAGIFLAVAFIAVGLGMSLNIEKIFKITPSLLPAVKLTFIISITNFAVITLFTVFSASVFIKNRLDLTAKADIMANFFKTVFLILVFSLLSPQIYYVSIGGLIYTAVLYIGHIINTKRLLPSIKIKMSLAKLKTIKELVFSGAWNSFGSLTQLLMVGMDLALANWLLDGRAMGLMSIANTITIASNSVLSIVVGAFTPTLAKTYAKGDLQQLHRQVSDANRFQAMIMFVPIVGIFTFAPQFYKLWMPYKGSADILLLSGITFVKVFDQFAGLTIQAAGNNFYLFNKLRGNAVAKLALSVLNIPIVLILVKIVGNYNWSIIIISGVSTTLYLIYNWTIAPKLLSKITGQGIKEYYKMILQALKMFAILLVPFSIISYFAPCNSWISFAVTTGLTGGLG